MAPSKSSSMSERAARSLKRAASYPVSDPDDSAAEDATSTLPSVPEVAEVPAAPGGATATTNNADVEPVITTVCTHTPNKNFSLLTKLLACPGCA